MDYSDCMEIELGRKEMKWHLINMKKQYLFNTIFVLLILSCNTARHNNALENPYKKLKNYNGDISFHIKDRIISPNQFVLNGINQMDATDTYSGYELTEM